MCVNPILAGTVTYILLNINKSLFSYLVSLMQTHCWTVIIQDNGIWTQPMSQGIRIQHMSQDIRIHHRSQGIRIHHRSQGIRIHHRSQGIRIQPVYSLTKIFLLVNYKNSILIIHMQIWVLRLLLTTVKVNFSYPAKFRVKMIGTTFILLY